MNLLPASIDIGSHSCLLLIADWGEREGRRCLLPKVQKADVVRLGEDLHEGGAISAERIAELCSILLRYRQTCHALGAHIEVAVMTEAVRKASNQDEVLAAVEKVLWTKPRVLSGDEEARMSWAAVAHWHGTGLVSIDLGGGSTELSQGKDFLSIPVGALRLQRQLGTIPGPEYKKWAKETFAELDLKAYAKKSVVLVGGTAVALAMLHMNMPKYDWTMLEGLELTPEDLDRAIQRVADLSKELRAQLPGLEHGRSEVIICGLFWIRSLVEKLKAEKFRISTLGLRFGVLLPPDVLTELFPAPVATKANSRRTDKD